MGKYRDSSCEQVFNYFSFIPTFLRRERKRRISPRVLRVSRNAIFLYWRTTQMLLHDLELGRDSPASSECCAPCMLPVVPFLSKKSKMELQLRSLRVLQRTCYC